MDVGYNGRFNLYLYCGRLFKLSRSQCRRRVALGTRVRQVNHSLALGGQQDSMAFLKIRLLRLFTALAVKTRKKRATFTSDKNENYDNAPCTK